MTIKKIKSVKQAVIKQKKNIVKYKIMLIGESMNMPSGFGGQMKILAEGLAKKGHETVVLTSSNNPRIDCPENLQEWNIANIKDLNTVDRLIHKFEPNAVIVFWYLHMVTFMTQLRSAPANCPVYFWVPWEGSTPPDQWDIAFRRVPKNRIVHLSEFAKNLWKDHVDSDVVIPHAYDPIFEEHFDLDKKQLRRKWAERLRFPLFEDSILILNVDRNIKHKRWDATFDFIAKLSEKINKRVQLIAHTKPKDTDTQGTNYEAFDLPALAKKFNIQDQVVFTNFDWNKPFSREELAELYHLADIRISTSEGEGFGIIGPESAICKCPQILTKHTTAPEIFGEDCKFLVEPAMRELHWNALFHVPNVSGMVDRAFSLLNGEAKREVDKVYKRVKEKFSAEVVINKWNDLICNDNSDDAWYKYRWGYQGYFQNRVNMRDLAIFISKLKSNIKVLEIGAFDGLFADFAISLGLNYQGIEWEARAIDEASPLAQMYITHADIKSQWPNVDAVVLTDILERLYALGEKVVFEVLEHAAYSNWLLIRTKPSYRWGIPLFDPSSVGFYLESKEMTRRHDLEIMASGFTPSLEHEVWQKGKDTSFVPSEIAKASKEK